MLPEKEAAIKDVATRLLKANNTVTCLEIKTELFIKYPDYYWDELIVSTWMDQNCQALGLTYTVDTNPVTHRVYSWANKPVNQPVVTNTTAKSGKVTTSKKITKHITAKAQKPASGAVYISKTKAIELMENNKGHFFTVVFEKKDKTTRKMNCQYLKDQGNSKLGYIKVKEPIALKKGENAIRNVNIQTLKELYIGKQAYKCR